ncbi:TPA: energy transducer TonB, partial [Xanthomonas vasicola pv. zeae]
KNMNPPKYPPAAFRAGVQGEVILIVDVDASGNVTNVSVEKSSRNRDLDRAAMDAARKWKFNASTVNGQKAAGRVRVPVNFALN